MAAASSASLHPKSGQRQRWAQIDISASCFELVYIAFEANIVQK